MIGGFDVAGRTGYAYGPAHARNPVAGFWDLPELNDRDRPRACAGLYAAVFHTVRANGITIAAIEHPLHKGSAHGDEGLTMLSGAAQAAAVNGGAKLILMPYPATWRKVFLGIAFPKNPKETCVAHCRALGWAIDDHNAGDAAGIWAWAKEQS